MTFFQEMHLEFEQLEDLVGEGSLATKCLATLTPAKAAGYEANGMSILEACDLHSDLTRIGA